MVGAGDSRVVVDEQEKLSRYQEKCTLLYFYEMPTSSLDMVDIMKKVK